MPGTVTITDPLRVRSSVQIVDAQDEQRWLLTDTKPPVHIQGRTLPPEMRSGPDEGTYLIFNDEDQNEKGGVIVSRDGAQVALDYSNAQGATMNTRFAGEAGVAQLLMHQMPDPSLPVEEVKSSDTPIRAVLAVTNYGPGSLFYLADHNGKPRILLNVDDTTGTAKIQVLDQNGQVVAQMPPEPGVEGKPSALAAAVQKPGLLGGR